jgi:hypothetical protein
MLAVFASRSPVVSNQPVKSYAEDKPRAYSSKCMACVKADSNATFVLHQGDDLADVFKFGADHVSFASLIEFGRIYASEQLRYNLPCSQLEYPPQAHLYGHD